MHGLYSKEKVKRIIVCVDGDDYRTEYIDFYYEPFEQCVARYQKAIDNGLTNVKYNVNQFTFETNYSTNRFVVTQLTYTGGWKVYATDELGNKQQLKVYNAQGGFAGFVAPKGNMSYFMCYQTPNIDKGLLMSVISLLGLGIIIVTKETVVKKKRVK